MKEFINDGSISSATWSYEPKKGKKKKRVVKIYTSSSNGNDEGIEVSVSFHINSYHFEIFYIPKKLICSFVFYFFFSSPTP